MGGYEGEQSVGGDCEIVKGKMWVFKKFQISVGGVFEKLCAAKNFAFAQVALSGSGNAREHPAKFAFFAASKFLGPRFLHQGTFSRFARKQPHGGPFSYPFENPAQMPARRLKLP